MTAETTNMLPPNDELMALADQLIATWNARVDFSVRIRDDSTLTRVGVGYGLTAHVHRLAAVIVRLLDEGLVLEAVPLVRTAYETALTAVWSVQIQDGPTALAKKHVRQRKAFIQTLNRSASLKRFAEKIIAEPPIEQDSAVSAESFEAICNDLTPGGADAYAHFRFFRFDVPSFGVPLRLLPQGGRNGRGSRVCAKGRT